MSHDSLSTAALARARFDEALRQARTLVADLDRLNAASLDLIQRSRALLDETQGLVEAASAERSASSRGRARRA